MSSGDHPSFPNPTIQEALCEIHFRLAEGRKWDASWYGEFFKRVQGEFPIFQPLTPIQMQFQITQHPSGAPMLVLPQVIRYQHGSRSVLIQLSEGRIVINSLPPYLGWNQVREDIKYAWGHLREIADPDNITRISARYINRIERSEPHETLGTWLVPNEYILAQVLRSQPGFIAQMDLHIDIDEHVALTLTDQGPVTGGNGAFIFDIGRISDVAGPPDTTWLLSRADALHEDIWRIFRSACGEKLERMLQGELV